MVTWNYVIIFLYFYTFNSICIQIPTMLFLLFPYFIIISQYGRVYPLNCIALCTYRLFYRLANCKQMPGWGKESSAGLAANRRLRHLSLQRRNSRRFQYRAGTPRCKQKSPGSSLKLPGEFPSFLIKFS